ncbi:TPA: glycosyl hydrolase family 17 protein [Legionella pneumophila]
MATLRYGIVRLLLILISTSISAQSTNKSQANSFFIDPFTVQAITSPISSTTAVGGSYLATYQLISNLPFNMPTPFDNSMTHNAPAGEFTLADNCQGKTLRRGETCTFSIGLNARTAGKKSATLTLKYGNNQVPLNIVNTTATGSMPNSPWVALIGVDYNPDHYPAAAKLNNHDVFYVGTMNAVPVTNVYMELTQLKAAGFTTVRSYQSVPYSWIDIIQQARALQLKVVYEAVIPKDGNNANITAAVTQLNNVIDVVGVTTFKNTVTLVFAGHENYNGSNVTYLTNSVTQLQNALTAKGITNIPVGSALISPDLVSPNEVAPNASADMKTLINSYTLSAPLAFDPYPFQFGVTPPDKAVSDITLKNSIAWDYAQVQKQSFYTPPRTILMAESGWATAGQGNDGSPPYVCGGNCASSVGNAAAYLSELYEFVRQPGNNSGVLVFEAYDEPEKSGVSAEKHYGVFDTNCILKNNNVNLLPNQSFIPSANLGCRGFSSGSLLVVVGSSANAQPPFTVHIVQTNPSTMQSGAMDILVPTQTRDNDVRPWPHYLIYPGASITVTGTGSNSCTITGVGVSTAPTAICNNAIIVNCDNADGIGRCFLPANF